MIMEITLTKILKRKLIETAKTDINQEAHILKSNKEDQTQVWKFDGGLKNLVATRIHYNENEENVLEEKYLFSLDDAVKHLKDYQEDVFDLTKDQIWKLIEKGLTNNELGTYEAFKHE